MMIRRLVLLCVLLTTMSTAYGLGLGRLEMQSALNQNFEGEIELTNVGNLTTDEVVSNLASQDDFERVGIERTALLLDLDFETVQRDDGTMVIIVTSSRPIVEPFLNFLVEVLWPNGRVLREYTVLLDPPVFGTEGIAAIEPVQTTPPTTRPEPARSSDYVPGARESGRTARPAPTGDPLQEGTFANGEYGMTGPGDTLWNVALKVRPNRSVSVQQTMLALVEANPEAFINGNVNLLKAGYVLRVPDLGEIRALSSAEAVSEVEYHNDEFESYRSGKQVAQLDATRRTRPSGGSTGRETSDGELVVSARNDSTVGDVSGSGASDGRTAALENELAVTREDLDRARRANAELNTRLDELSEQMETMNALISKKNEDLALLQNEIQKMQRAAAATPPPQPQASGSLLTNTYVLGGLVLLGIALVAGLLVFMRRRQQEDSDLAQPFVAAQEQESMPAPDQEP
ncbi:MAG: FimV/HubP family polar landmark protein [Pseudomonadota bacterium]